MQRGETMTNMHQGNKREKCVGHECSSWPELARFYIIVTVQVQKESKRVEQLERKLANQKLLEEEEGTLKSSARGGAPAKVTRAQIQETKVSINFMYMST